MHKNCLDNTDLWNVTTTTITDIDIQYRYNIITSTVNTVHICHSYCMIGQNGLLKTDIICYQS